MATPSPEQPRSRRAPKDRPPRAQAVRELAAKPLATIRHNWALYAFLFLLPLQNIQTGYIPKLPGGINFLNIGFLLALVGAWRMRGHISHWSTVHRWVWLYVAWSVITLVTGDLMHPDPNADRFNQLKDSILGVLLLFVVEMSVTNWTNLKRVLLFMLLPLPYILRVTWAQHASVSTWHYKDDLRLQGTFALLGANEFASFCVTVALMLFALLLAGGLTKIWRALLVGGIACMSLGILWAYSRTAYIAVLLGAVTIVLLWRGRWKMVIPIVLALVFVPALLPHSVTERFGDTHVEGAQVDESTQDRYAFWDVALGIWQKQPFFGAGNMTFAYISPYGMDTHNLYMRTLAEQGLVGITILVGMFLSFLRAAWRTYRDSSPGSVTYALGLGMLGAWPALALGNFWGDRFTYAQMIGYFWVFVALMLKAREFTMVEREQEKTSAQSSPTPASTIRRHAMPRRLAQREQALRKELPSQ